MARHLVYGRPDVRWCISSLASELFATIEPLTLEEQPARDMQPPGQLLEELLATDAVSPASRAVLILHFKEELSLPAVAAILEVPLGTVKSRLAYGLNALRKQLGHNRRL